MARLMKSRNHWVDGVVGGVAEYFHVNPDLLRVILLVGVFILRMHFLITVYIILMILMPAASRSKNKDQDDEVQEIDANSVEQQEVETAVRTEGRVRERKVTLDSGRTLQIFGVLLILAGVAYLIRNQFPTFWFSLEDFWYDFRDILDEFRTILLGVALILGGFWLLYKDKKIKKWFRNK